MKTKDKSIEEKEDRNVVKKTDKTFSLFVSLKQIFDCGEKNISIVQTCEYTNIGVVLHTHFGSSKCTGFIHAENSGARILKRKTNIRLTYGTLTRKPRKF